jgi:hypothetical protein
MLAYVIGGLGARTSVKNYSIRRAAKYSFQWTPLTSAQQLPAECSSPPVG